MSVPHPTPQYGHAACNVRRPPSKPAFSSSCALANSPGSSGNDAAAAETQPDHFRKSLRLMTGKVCFFMGSYLQLWRVARQGARRLAMTE